MADLYKKNSLYRTIQLFCAIRGVSISAMCKSAEISPGIVTDLKMGRKSTVQIDTASRIARALGVDVTRLEQNEFFLAASWDVETCLKWNDCDSDADREYILKNYGVDKFLFHNAKDAEAVQRVVMGNKKEPAPVQDELSDDTREIIELVKNLPAEKLKLLLPMIKAAAEAD